MGYTTVRCGLFSMNCTKIHIVPAVVGPERRAFDIIFRTYVNVSVSRETLVYNLDRFMINPDRYLVNFMGEGPFKFTIFKSNHVSLLFTNE